jgi:hypothetical protein
MKTCSKCKRRKPVTAFNRKLDGHQSACRRCGREVSRTYYRQNTDAVKKRSSETGRTRREAAILFKFEYLKAHPCVDCGEPDPLVLDFDHLTDKKLNVAKLVSWGATVEALMSEIVKCEVRCANCHRRVTMKRANVLLYRLVTGHGVSTEAAASGGP